MELLLLGQWWCLVKRMWESWLVMKLATALVLWLKEQMQHLLQMEEKKSLEMK